MKSMAYQALEELGRDGFYVKKETKVDCPDCVLGPTGQSITRCVTCSSEGFITTNYFIPVRAIISWRHLESRSVMIGAIVVQGDCGVAISVDDYNNIDLDNDKFIVDNKEVVLTSVVPSDQNALYLLGFNYATI